MEIVLWTNRFDSLVGKDYARVAQRGCGHWGEPLRSKQSAARGIWAGFGKFLNGFSHDSTWLHGRRHGQIRMRHFDLPTGREINVVFLVHAAAFSEAILFKKFLEKS
jgi:hypothetical protein